MMSAWASVIVIMRGPIALLSGNLDIYTTNMSVYLARTKKTAYVVRRRGVAQPGSASALGAEGREFESLHPDHLFPFPNSWPINLRNDSPRISRISAFSSKLVQKLFVMLPQSGCGRPDRQGRCIQLVSTGDQRDFTFSRVFDRTLHTKVFDLRVIENF
jgi:hypothetical protein